MGISIGRLGRCVLVSALFCGHLVAQHGPTDCPIVDRGSPTDGMTTVTVTEDPHPCDEGAKWDGWNCMTLASDANNNGVTYRVEVRWNRVDQPLRGSFVWVKGGYSKKFFRDALPHATQVQDKLADEDEVRTIEVRFLGNGTGSYPKNGFPNISAVFADFIEFLVTQKFAVGVIGFFGSSSSSTLGANALAFHRLDEVLDGFVAAGGPYGGDLEAECTDPAAASFMNTSQRAVMDNWNWEDTTGENFCTEMAPFAGPSYDCFSALGSGADTEFEEVMVAVLMGQNDGNKPWIKASAMDWLAQTDSETQTFDEPLAPHQVMKTPDGAARIYHRISGIVDATLRRKE